MRRHWRALRQAVFSMILVAQGRCQVCEMHPYGVTAGAIAILAADMWALRRHGCVSRARSCFVKVSRNPAYVAAHMSCAAFAQTPSRQTLHAAMHCSISQVSSLYWHGVGRLRCWSLAHCRARAASPRRHLDAELPSRPNPCLWQDRHKNLLWVQAAFA